MSERLDHAEHDEEEEQEDESEVNVNETDAADHGIVLVEVVALRY